MNSEQRKHLEKRLQAERERAIKAIRSLDESRASNDDDGDLTLYPFHLADEGTDTMEQEKTLLLLSNEGRLLLEIDEALRRMYRDDESFGKCGGCGDEIAFERLDIVPWATMCVSCQRELEERGAETPVGGEASGEAA